MEEGGGEVEVEEEEAFPPAVTGVVPTALVKVTTRAVSMDRSLRTKLRIINFKTSAKCQIQRKLRN